LNLGKYSIGIGDRFAQQGKAQLTAILKAKENGVAVTPVWNKSYREHKIVNSQPAATRKEADSAVNALKFTGSYFVDADHVGLGNVDYFIESSDFFTIDVADFIGRNANQEIIQTFVRQHKSYLGELKIPGLPTSYQITETIIRDIAQKFLFAVAEAGKVYRHILSAKGEKSFIVEISMDETDEPQSPVELLFILAAIASEKIPVRTIAPKFTGRFNKGIDYIGDIDRFTREFEQDVLVLKWAVEQFHLPGDFKLSVHSGSDKFSIYRTMNRILKKHDAGVHLKTAGTTWLEEIIGLAAADNDGLVIAKEIYKRAYSRYDELCGPYAAVIDIEQKKLPTPNEVNQWDSPTYVSALKHDLTNKRYNKQFRQMLHVAYKVAAEMGDEYIAALTKYEKIIGEHVTENIYERHLKPLFMD